MSEAVDAEAVLAGLTEEELSLLEYDDEYELEEVEESGFEPSFHMRMPVLLPLDGLEEGAARDPRCVAAMGEGKTGLFANRPARTASFSRRPGKTRAG